MTVTSDYVRALPTPDSVANTYTAGDQYWSDVLHLSDGGYVVAYNNQDASDGFVLLDFYGPDGQHVVRRTAYASLNTTSAFEAPALMQQPDGTVFLAWADVHGPNPGVKYSTYSAAGDVLALENVLHVGNGVSQVSTAAVGSSTLVTFVQAGKVQFQFSEPIDPATPGVQSDSQIAALADGGFVVTWMNNPAGGIDDQEIRAAVFNADGSARGPAFTVDTTGSNVSPAVAALHNGHWAVVYADTSWADESGSSGISLQIRDANGNNVTPGGTIHVNIPSALSEQTPDVTVLSNGFILVSWAREANGNSSDIYGRLFTPDGTPLVVGGSYQFAIASGSGIERNPAVVAADDGAFIAVWDNADNGAADVIVHVERITRSTSGDADNDTFFGDAMGDFIHLESGNDTLGGGKGRDTLVGGSGSDRFVYRPGDGADTIVDFTSDFVSRDKIDVSAFALSFAALMTKATQVGADTVFDFGGGDILTLHGVQKASLAAADFASVITGDDGDNVLAGTPGYDTIQGLGGSDTVVFAHNLDQYNLSDFGSRITVSGPDGVDTLVSIEHLQFADGTIHVVDGNPLFDTAFYMRDNLDVFHAGANALGHFNSFGWHEGRDPNAFFDTAGYLAANGDVAAAGINPLDHYHYAGWHEGRDPSAGFDTTLYLLRNPDVAAAGMDPLLHYLQWGRAEGRQACAAVGQQIVGGFDAQYYLLHNPDVAAAGLDPLFHYSVVGWQEGRDPNAWFDSDGYLAAYADVAAAGINPLTHYNASGWHEGRDPSLGFDTAGYLAANPDVAAAQVNPLQHFLQHGIYEGRQAVNDGAWDHA